MTHPTDAQLEVLELADRLERFLSNVVTISGDLDIQDAQRARWNARRDRIEDRLCDAVARLRETQTKEMK